MITAIQRAFEGNSIRSAYVTVLMQVTQPKAPWMSRSWDFFVIEYGSEDEMRQHIEVFLFPDV